MAVNYKDWHKMLPPALHEYCTSVHTSTGATPSFINIHHEGHASHWGRSPVCRSSAEVQAWWNLKCMTTLYNYIKRSWKKLPTRRFVPMKFKKETLCPKAYYLFNQTPRASGRLTMIARMQYFYNYGWWQSRTSYECRCSQEILCQKIRAR